MENMEIASDTQNLLQNSGQEVLCKSLARWNSDKSKFPTGRRPWVLVPGLEYNLEIDDLIPGEVIEGDTEDEEVEGGRVRTERYKLDAFVCESGYLSDEELCMTPVLNRKERQAQTIRARVASERKRNREKVEQLGEPEVLGVLFWTGRGAVRAVFKKWNGMVFCSTPINTGLSMEKSLSRKQGLEQMSSVEPPSSPLPDPASQPRVDRPKSPVLPFLHPQPLLPEEAGVCPDGAGQQEALASKYSLKYKIEWTVREIMKSRAGTDISPEGLLKLLDPGLLVIYPESAVRKYSLKYFYKYQHGN